MALAAEADERAFPAPPPALAEPSPSPSPAAPRKRRRARHDDETPPVNAAAIMESAQVAKTAGETEKAIRLMRIAAGMPGGERAAATADAWEREWLQPAR